MSDVGAPATGPVESVTTNLVDTTSAELFSQPKAAPEPAAEEPAEDLAPKVEPKKEDDKLASKFAALARKEKEQRLAQKAFEARVKAFEESTKKPAEIVAPVVEEEPLEIRIKRNPFEELAKLGLSYETLTEAALNNGQLPKHIQEELLERKLETKMTGTLGAKIAELEKKLAAKEESEAAKAKADEDSQMAARLDAFKGSIKEAISAKVDDFELLNAEGEDGVETVYSLIAQDAEAKRKAAEEEGEEWDGQNILTIAEAAQKVEDHLLEIAKKRVNLNKVKGLLQPPTPPKTEAKVPAKPASPTLSNQTQQAQGNKPAFMSDEESRREAAKLIKFNA